MFNDFTIFDTVNIYSSKGNWFSCWFHTKPFFRECASNRVTGYNPLTFGNLIFDG